MSERLEDIIAFRRAKLDRMRAAGIDPYPATTNRSNTNQEVLEQFDSLQGKELILAGRILSLRTMGKLAFFHIDDGTGRIQVLIKEDEIGAEQFSFFVENFDIGDFIEATGSLFLTKTEEKTLQAKSFRVLAKTLLPLPSEHYGVENEELRLRKRYLDILLNPEVKEMFVKKNVFWQTVRQFLAGRGFLEVQTPVLENVPGGADAEPFVTHHNALDRDFYLRISLELALKRLLVAGYEKVFEIGRLFRNEGIDRDHLQEYDDTEFYWAFADHEDGMELVEAMYKEIVKNVCGTMETEYEGHKLDWSKPWPRLDYFYLFKEHAGLDLNTATLEELREKGKSLGVPDVENLGKGRLIDSVYKRTVRPKLIEPSFLVGHPLDISPLSKSDPTNPRKVLRFQVLAAASELGNGWAELNDGIDQRKRFEEQEHLRAAGDAEAQMLDEDFVEAIEYGLPPAVGFGMSERVFSVLMNKSIRETVIFPPMREEQSEQSTGKSKQTKIAVAILNKAATMEPWQELNTIAHLSAAFAARAGKPLLMQDEISTQDYERIKLNVQHAIMIKTAPSNELIKEARSKAKESGLEVSEFIREMIETTDDKKVIEWTKGKDFSDVEYLGLLVFGDKKEVEKLTSEFPLHS
jgi:lysyl-tRNA synthetase class 2